MSGRPTDALARLAAADPAGATPIDERERERLLRTLVAAERAPACAPPRRARRARLLRMVLVVPALLLAAGGALAASGVIRIGAPAERAGAGRLFEGFRGGSIESGTVRMLPITAADPGGGPPWGLRVLSTKRGEGCVQVGRVVDGKLGAIGEDDAFGDDGQFHAFAEDSAFARRTCTLLDGANRLYVNATVGDIPASAWVGYGNGGCVPGTATHAERFTESGKPRPICAQADERDLYYGLLGPYAQSITYVLDGRAHTQATVGPEGAYLLVTRASAKQLFDFNAGGTQDVVPVDGPITAVHYRGGATCHLTSRSWIGGKDACTPPLAVPVGWVAPSTRAPSAAQVASPVHAQLVRGRAGRYEIVLSFVSRVAITNARSAYTLKWHSPGMPARVYAGGPAAAPSRSAAVGETIVSRIGGLGRQLLPGVTKGEVIFQDATGPEGIEEGPGTVERVVGRFAVRVP
jgi:hypothetical protein